MVRTRRFWISLSALVVACLVAGGAALAVSVTRESEASSNHHGGAAALDARAFIEMMVPHHQMALDMARIAKGRSRELPVVEVANDILAQQRWEIRLMRRWYERWYKTQPREPHLSAADMAAMGMGADMERLGRARPFAPAFYEAMIPHHAGGIVMAQRVLLGDPPAPLARLARAIIAGQSQEIGKMQRYAERVARGASRAVARPPELKRDGASRRAEGGAAASATTPGQVPATP
jgi:uncharacterized protein (DUF305 family)